MGAGNTLSIILFSPLVAAALIALFGRRRGVLAATISVASAATQMVLALAFLFKWSGEPFTASVEWLSLGDFSIQMGCYLSPLAALLLFVVVFVGFWIHVFAIGYSDHDESRGRFFGGLSIFMFSMTGIVLADNLFMMFVFWELVGFSSYMLIGHYLTTEAANASKKAFIVNRVGDFGFLIGIIWCYWHYGTANLEALQDTAPALLAAGASTWIALLLLCGAIGKSAQMPLHVWLPDAMAGPTPVSALIHAATMVAAGVFLLGRIWFLFTPEALDVVLWIGLITALFAAFTAFGQNDIKRILAYSTLSQLGFMVAAFALGTRYGTVGALYGVGAAHFHLLTHAFFKALMFLGAGSVIHATHHEQDIYRMGGLLKRMPITAITFLIGVLAIAGVPLLSGFYSKDAILLLAWQNSPLAFYLLAGASLLTAMYMGRLFFVVFIGEPRSEQVRDARESRWDMVLPLIVLALGSIVAGNVSIFPHAIGEFLHSAVLHPEGGEKTFMFVLSSALAGGGLLLAFIIYYRPKESRDTLERKVPALFGLASSKLWFDEIYSFYVRAIQQRFAEILAFLEQILIQGLAVRGAGGIASMFGSLTRATHTGNVQTYAFWFLAGVVLFWLFAMEVF